VGILRDGLIIRFESEIVPDTIISGVREYAALAAARGRWIAMICHRRLGSGVRLGLALFGVMSVFSSTAAEEPSADVAATSGASNTRFTVTRFSAATAWPHSDDRRFAAKATATLTESVASGRFEATSTAAACNADQIFRNGFETP
jgi:hypothetical protein